MDQQQCNARYTTLTSDMICAVSDSPPDGTCSGDSGGPLYDPTNNMIVGANSWGKSPCGGTDPSVFSRVGEQVSQQSVIRCSDNDTFTRPFLSLSLSYIQFESWIKPTICNNHSLPKPDFCPDPNPPLPPPVIAVSYYAAENWNNIPATGLKSLSPFKSEVVGTIDFPYTNQPFAGSNKMYNVAALFEGVLHFPMTGTYKLCVRSDDGSKVYMGGDIIIDFDGIHGASMTCVDKSVDADDHEISVEYFQAEGGHFLQLLWQKPGDTSVSVIGQYDWESVSFAMRHTIMSLLKHRLISISVPFDNYFGFV